MKLATIRDGTRDGRLHLVAADMSRMVPATAATTLRAALDDWTSIAPSLQAEASALRSKARGVAFDPACAMAPLPRAVQWLDASAFPNHGELMQRAFALPADMHKGVTALIYQGASDSFLGPEDDILATDESQGIDFEAEIGVVVDDVPMGVSVEAAADHIKLLVLLNDVSLRAFAPGEMKTGFGFLHAKPATAFAPLAITPDEAGQAWRGSRLHRPVAVDWNGTRFGTPDAGEMGLSFAELIAFVARTRCLGAGTIVGSGTVSNKAYATVGSACIAERRAIEMIEAGAARTGFMRFGDRVRIEATGDDGATLFGTIEQRVRQSP